MGEILSLTKVSWNWLKEYPRWELFLMVFINISWSYYYISTLSSATPEDQSVFRTLVGLFVSFNSYLSESTWTFIFEGSPPIKGTKGTGLPAYSSSGFSFSIISPVQRIIVHLRFSLCGTFLLTIPTLLLLSSKRISLFFLLGISSSTKRELRT